MFAFAGFTHQSDAPDLAFQWAETRAHFDVEVTEEAFSDRRFIDAGGDGDGVELPNLMAFLGSD